MKPDLNHENAKTREKKIKKRSFEISNLKSRILSPFARCAPSISEKFVFIRVHLWLIYLRRFVVVVLRTQIGLFNATSTSTNVLEALT